jgi:hypothetical protein
MANFGEMSGIKQWAVVLEPDWLLSVCATPSFKTQRDQNAQPAGASTKMKENAELVLSAKLAEIERQLASLKQQLDIERRCRTKRRRGSCMMDADVRPEFEIRRYTSKATAQGTSTRKCL